MAPIATEQVRSGRKFGLFYGWWVVAASASIVAYASGVFYYGFTALFVPIQSEFHWSYAATAAAFSFSRFEGGIEAPIVGWAIDRFGSRFVMLIGVVLMALGFFALSMMRTVSLFFFEVDALIVFYLIYGILLAAGFGAGAYHPSHAIAVQWFRRMRSRAIGLISLAGGLGGAVFAPVVVWLIAVYGWRSATLIVGVGMLVVGIPAAMVLRQSPQSCGYLPDGDYPRSGGDDRPQPGAKREPMPAEPERSYTLGETMRTSSFWKLVVSFNLLKIATTSVIVHQMPFLLDKGVSQAEAAAIFGFTLFVSVPSRFLFGWLGDYWDKRLLLILTFAVETVGVVILLFASQVEFLYLAFGLWGMGEGRAALQPAIRAQYFGPKAYALISGWMSALTNTGTMIGPIFAGYIFDVTKSYTIALEVFVVCYVLAAITLFTARPPSR